MDKGYLIQKKGRTKLRQYKAQLKDAQKALEIAEENLQEYKESLGMVSN